MDESTAPDDAPVRPSDPGPDVDPPHGGARTRTWVVVVLVAVAVVIGAATAVLVVVDSSGIHDGPGTATFTWAPVHQGTLVTPPPQSFTGEIDGLALQGTSTLLLDASSFGGTTGALPTTPIPAFRYRGTFAGSPFDLTLYYHLPAVALPTDPAAAQAFGSGVRFTVSGTYGHSAVRATVSVPSPAVPTAGHPATITGTVGHWRVTGTIPFASGSSSTQTATAHFVVSG